MTTFKKILRRIKAHGIAYADICCSYNSDIMIGLLVKQ